MTQVYILKLVYDVCWPDSDYGLQPAGEGSRSLRASFDREKMEWLRDRYNPVVEAAENEHTIVPRQPNNQILKSWLGFDLHDLDQDNAGYRLEVETLRIEDT